MRIKNIILVVITAFLLTACTDKDNSKRVLENEGYTHISFQGYDWLGCSKDDIFRTGFYAVNKNGKSVRGTVCNSFFSGSVVRIK